MRTFALIALCLSLPVAALGAPQVYSAEPDPDAGLLFIYGADLPQKPDVILGSTLLELDTANTEEVVAVLPPEVGPGTHRLVVGPRGCATTSDGCGPDAAKLFVVVGAHGPTGPEGGPGVAGPQGPQGPVGPQGPAGTSFYTTRYPLTVPAHTVTHVKPSCPGPTVAVSGGFTASGHDSPGFDATNYMGVQVLSSGPNNVQDGWVIVLKNSGDQGAYGLLWVTCAKK